MGLPEIRVVFKHLAQSASARSSRGHLAIIVQDATKSFASKTYATLSDVDSSDYTAANYKSIAAAFLANPFLVSVVRIGTNDDIDDAAEALEKLPYNWVCTPVSSLQDDLVTYVKAINTDSRARKAKAIVAGQSSVDDKHIVNFANTTVTLAGEVSTTAAAAYIPRLAGILAACPIEGSVTYYELDDLKDIADVANPGTSVDGGNLVIIRDEDTFRIARGVTTLQTISGDNTADMKSIAVVEAMDLISADIIAVFKANYMSKVRNSADNQALFVSDILEYFRELEAVSVLDPDGGNTADIDVTAMRQAWAAAGTPVADLTDAQVRLKTYRSYVYVAATVRILDAMEDLHMTIALE